MRILAIETSCDETAVSVLDIEGGESAAQFKVLGNALLSQIDIHKEYGGVFPALAKREHAKNLVPILESALGEAHLLMSQSTEPSPELRTNLEELLSREVGLSDNLFNFLQRYDVPKIDAIAVTHGPGLEPALWVGVNFAKALALAWQKPLIGVNHMEGHLLSALAEGMDDLSSFEIRETAFPLLGLLISGGHTELVAASDWLSYELVGQTRDDAVGEAYDKVARMLGLEYPGGPLVSRLADQARDAGVPLLVSRLPRPMISDATCDFSFSGLKTAVLYLVKDRDLSDEEKGQIAREFEDAVAEVLWKKTARAIDETDAQTLALGGGVSANANIRRVFTERIAAEYPHVALRIPKAAFTTDNAIMIGIAAFYRALRNEYADPESLAANGNLSLT